MAIDVVVKYLKVGNNSNPMKMLLGLLLLGIITVSGCTSVPGSGGTGNFILKISDQPANISSFDSLIVSFTDARVFKIGEENGTAFQIFDLNGTSVDLTQLVGEKSITILNSVLPSGTYSKVELNVESVEGVVDGETVEVEVPSNQLKVIRPFVISDGESTEFIFDIDVTQRGQIYNLLPVIGKSGVVGKDIPKEDVEDVECSVDEDCDEEFACIENVCVGAINGTNGTDGLTGNLVLLVSDAKADIEDFDSLVVSFSKTRIFSSEGFEEFSLNGTSVDITQLVGEKAISVLNVEIAAGTYSKIEMHVSDADGIVNGDSVDVKVPSNKLKVIKTFTVGEGTTTTFVFDINVVKTGQGYNLLPVIGESGTTEEVPTEEVECTLDTDCDSGFVCTENICIMNETNETIECTLDTDCNSSSICIDSVCVMNETNETVECTIDSDCNSTFICVNNVCVENPSPEQCDFENVTSVHDCGNETFMLNFTFPDIGFNITFGNETIVCTNLENITSECQDYLNVCSEANLCQ